MSHLQVSELIAAPRMDAFEFLTDPKNQTFLLSPIIDVVLGNPEVNLKRGCEVHFEMARFYLNQSVRLRVEDMLRGSRLTYRQVEGLFASWMHTMKFEDQGDKSTRVTDLVDYEVPGGIVGLVFDDLLIKRDLKHLLLARLRKVKAHFHSLNSASAESSSASTLRASAPGDLSSPLTSN